jgi:hypothetical protein
MFQQLLGLHGFHVGLLARVFFYFSGNLTRRLLGMFSHTRSVVLSGWPWLQVARWLCP